MAIDYRPVYKLYILSLHCMFVLRYYMQLQPNLLQIISANSPLDVLRQLNLADVTLVNTSRQDIVRTVVWYQREMSMSPLGIKREYKECEYTSPSGRSVQVFVAEDTGTPPGSFSTTGYNSLLHMGIKEDRTFDSSSAPIFFVIHPRDWKPYQHRFFFNSTPPDPKEAVILTIVKANIGDYLIYLG